MSKCAMMRLGQLPRLIAVSPQNGGHLLLQDGWVEGCNHVCNNEREGRKRGEVACMLNGCFEQSYVVTELCLLTGGILMM